MWELTSKYYYALKSYYCRVDVWLEKEYVARLLPGRRSVLALGAVNALLGPRLPEPPDPAPAPALGQSGAHARRDPGHGNVPGGHLQRPLCRPLCSDELAEESCVS